MCIEGVCRKEAGGTCRVLNQVHSIFSLDQLRERSDLVLSLSFSCQVGLFDLHCALELIQAFAVTLLRIEHTHTSSLKVQLTFINNQTNVEEKIRGKERGIKRSELSN